MFPIFLWVEEYKGFKNFQISFDSDYSCKVDTKIYKNMPRKKEKKQGAIVKLREYEYIKKDTIIVETLEIKKNEKRVIKSFYGKNIEGVKMVVGQNGVGKSSVFEILTLFEKTNSDIDYFIVYKIDNSENFLIEGNVTGIDLSPLDKFKFIKGTFHPDKFKFSYIIDKIGNYISYPNWSEYSNICEKSNVCLIKYNMKDNIDIKKIKDENGYRNKSRTSKHKYDYSIITYKRSYEFLCDVKLMGKSIENNYKNTIIKITFEKDDSYRELNKLIGITQYKNEIDSDKVCRKIRNELDITKNIDDSSGNSKIIRAFCNRAYFPQLLNAFENKYEDDITVKIYIQDRINLIKKSDGDEYSLKKEIEDYIFEEINKIHSDFLKKYNTKSIEELLRILHEYFRENIDVDMYQNEYIEVYKKMRELNLFQGTNSEIFDRNSSNKKEIYELLEILDNSKIREYHLGDDTYNPEVNNFFKISIEGCSDGEEANIKLFSKIDWFLKNDCLDKKYITILLDEPDVFLHPELNRKLFAQLTETLSEYKEKKFKLMITSHSPYFLAEVKKEDTILLELREDGNPRIILNKEKFETFGANIMDLYKKSFFMESTFGEFAKGKIQEIIEDFNNKKNRISEERKWEIWETIQLIGENLVRKKLENMYYEYFETKKEKSEIEKLIEEKGLSKDDITKLIEKIKGI